MIQTRKVSTMLEPQFYSGFVIGFTAATFLGILFDFLIRRRNIAKARAMQDAADAKARTLTKEIMDSIIGKNALLTLMRKDDGAQK